MNVKGYEGKSWMPPGSLVHVGEESEEKVNLSLITFNQESFQELESQSIDEIKEFIQKEGHLRWLNVEAVYDIELIEKIGAAFGIHDLVLEDIVNNNQRPKMDLHEDYAFIVLKLPHWIHESESIEIEQVSMIIGSDYIVTFNEKNNLLYDYISSRIKNKKSHIRKYKIGFLAYSIMDVIVDNYFYTLAELGDDLDEIEEEMAKNTHPDIIKRVHKIRRQLISMRRTIWPLREIVHEIDKKHHPFFQGETMLYIRDLYDHTIRVFETVETYRDMLSSILDYYMSSVSHKMNEVMKLLTIISTIFIPITFVVGIYGMNFKFIPELQYKYSYFVVWLFIVFIVIGMVAYFKKKKWL